MFRLTAKFADIIGYEPLQAANGNRFTFFADDAFNFALGFLAGKHGHKQRPTHWFLQPAEAASKNLPSCTNPINRGILTPTGQPSTQAGFAQVGSAGFLQELVLRLIQAQLHQNYGYGLVGFVPA